MSSDLPPRFTRPERSYDAYIFDCDGTLADSMPLHFEAWRRALAEANAPFEFTWPLFVARAGMSIERTVEELAEQFSHPMDPRAVSDRQRDHFRALEHTLEPVHTVWSFARELWQQGVPLAVASGSARPAVERTLALLNVRDWFPVVVTPEDVSAGKPAPDMFLLAAEKLAVTPERCLVLEDGEMGFEAARRAGMDYVIVRER